MFKKHNPKKLRFNILCFFEPFDTIDIKMHIDNAKLKGWTFVKNFKCMYIFSTDDENAKPLEVDEKQTFNSITMYMNIIFVPLNILTILFYVFQLNLLYNDYLFDFNYFISSNIYIGSVLFIVSAILFNIIEMVNYFVWYILTKISFANDKGIVVYNKFTYRFIRGVLKFLIIASLLFSFSFYIVSKFNLNKNEIYIDSQKFEKQVSSSIFTTKISYKKIGQPDLIYTILEPKFDYIYDLSKLDLLKTPFYKYEPPFKYINSNAFKSIDAYEEYNKNTKTGNYILFYKDKIIILNLTTPATDDKILDIINKITINMS